MPDTVVEPSTASAPTHPRCPECAVPMWLVKIDRHVLSSNVLGAAAADRLHYECKVCGAASITASAAPAP